jgi:fluoroacetyl-CoA thioesterase
MNTATDAAKSLLQTGLEGTASVTVTAALTAPVMGSGTVTVYATPGMVALMEAAAVACVEQHLAPGQATLGVQLDVSHTAATPPGMSVFAKATLTAVDGRKLTFEIEARDEVEVIGRAKHTRIVVDTNRFNAKVASKHPKA